jgi:hypothetical protein
MLLLVECLTGLLAGGWPMEKVGIYGLYCKYIFIVNPTQEETFSVVAHSFSTISFLMHFILSGSSRLVNVLVIYLNT